MNNNEVVDRDIIIRNQIILFNLICALAKQLTGKIPITFTPLEDGSTVKTNPNIQSISWAEET